jgi:hypothetical protein
MSDASCLQEKARMFERRAEEATNPISKQHYKEIAAHYRSLAVEHLEIKHDEMRINGPTGPHQLAKLINFNRPAWSQTRLR